MTFARPQPTVPTEKAMRQVVLHQMANARRSLQRDPGPSEIGGCERRLGYRMVFGANERREDAKQWRPQVGTFGHAGLSQWFLQPRWMTDVRIAGPIAGSLDLYDTETATIVDFKFVGLTTLREARAGRVSEKYLTQLALYGLGMQQAGHAVETLALWFLPSAGSLDDAHYHDWAYDERVAWAAVARRDGITHLISSARGRGEDPATVLASLDVQEDYCGSCPALPKYCPGINTEPASLGLTYER